VVRDQAVRSAASRILQRAERQDNTEKVVDTFVDVGFLPLLHNQNNQVFYGRRGTGKTHVLRVLETRLREDDERNTVVYIDCRTLGSTSQFSDPTVPLRTRCTALFRDVLGEIHTALLERIFGEPFGSPSPQADRALESLDALSSAIAQPVETYITESITESIEAGTSESTSAGLNANITGGLGVRADIGSDESTQEQRVKSVRVETEDKVLFPSLHRHVSDTLKFADTYLYILLDEWSSLPTDIQPYLAEFLKRSVLPVRRAVLKIASLEYRSRFASTNDEQRLGFELGADISTTQDLDEYFVFDRNPEKMTNEYADMLLRHLNGELPPDYLRNEYRIKSSRDLASKLFTDRNTFKEVARACEGVVRDLINIFSLAFNHAFRNDRVNIDRKALLAAAQQWFEQDKSNSLDDHLQVVLRRIVDEVIGTRNARSFLLPRHLERNTVIQKLFDARVLHHMQRGYADKDNPGVRYNIYTLDYGTYVGLMGTSQPTIDLFEGAEGPDLVVPFDDKRSIRRIILNEKVLA
jgi:hypothetical protein